MTTTLITDEDIAAAERQADEAARVRADVERTLVESEYRPELGERMAAAGSRARHSALHVTQLRERQAAQQAALQARANAEADIAADLPGIEKELSKAHDTTVAAFVAAEAAMVAALRAAHAYEQLIAETDAKLTVRGLRSSDGLGEHETGGAGSRQVRTNGRWWIAIPPAALLARSLAVIAETALDRRHVLAQLGRGHLLGYSAARWSDLVRELDTKVPRVKR